MVDLIGMYSTLRDAALVLAVVSSPVALAYVIYQIMELFEPIYIDIPSGLQRKMEYKKDHPDKEIKRKELFKRLLEDDMVEHQLLLVEDKRELSDFLYLLENLPKRVYTIIASDLTEKEVKESPRLQDLVEKENINLYEIPAPLLHFFVFDGRHVYAEYEHKPGEEYGWCFWFNTTFLGNMLACKYRSLTKKKMSHYKIK